MRLERSMMVLRRGEKQKHEKRGKKGPHTWQSQALIVLLLAWGFCEGMSRFNLGTEISALENIN